MSAAESPAPQFATLQDAADAVRARYPEAEMDLLCTFVEVKSGRKVLRATIRDRKHDVAIEWSAPDAAMPYDAPLAFFQRQDVDSLIDIINDANDEIRERETLRDLAKSVLRVHLEKAHAKSYETVMGAKATLRARKRTECVCHGEPIWRCAGVPQFIETRVIEESPTVEVERKQQWK